MNYTKRFYVFLAACALILSVGSLSGEASVKALSPVRIGEFAASDENSDDGTYPYRPDPKGKYYHFYDFMMGGDSQWDVFLYYEEQFTATSTLPPIKGITYGPENLLNGVVWGERRDGGNREDVWCEGVKGYGFGERVNMRVITKAWYDNDDNIYFTDLMIVNGHAKNETTWKNNSRVKTLRLYAGGEPWCDLQLKDTIKPQIFALGENLRIYPAKSGKAIPEHGALAEYIRNLNPNIEIPKTPTYQTDLSFEIVEVYRGAKYDDTCITGIALNVYGGLY